MKKPIHNQFIAEISDSSAGRITGYSDANGPVTNLLGLQNKETKNIIRGSEKSLIKAKQEIATEMAKLKNNDILATSKNRKQQEKETTRNPNNLDLEVGMPLQYEAQKEDPGLMKKLWSMMRGVKLSEI